ncbi:MAG: hypothetical protein ABIU05_16895 [Nitrospirales bacterium]
MNKQCLAETCRVSTNTITAWIRRGCPSTKRKDGSYLFDLTAVKAWRRKTQRIPASVPKTLAAAQLRKESALATLREMEVSRKRGELIERVVVEQDAFRAGRLVRDSILALPDRLAGILAAESDQRKTHALLTKELRQALQGLHNKFSKEETEAACR